MTLTLSGTSGLSDVDGSAATPAIRETDANTGIFFPAADTIAFSEGGAEAMRIDSSGNVGIAATPSAWTFKALQVGSGSISVATGSSVYSSANWYYDGASKYIGTGAALIYEQNFNLGAHIWYTSASGTAGNTVALTERMRIDSSGNVGIGISPTTRFTVLSNTNTYASITYNDSASSPYGYLVQYRNLDPNGTGQQFIDCFGIANLRAQIRSNGGLANYSANNVNLSDRREKINFAPAGDYLAKICAIPVQTFNYIDQNLEEDDGLTLGVVAQDVQAVAPELVMESNWAAKNDEPKMRLSIYQTDLQYALMKCIQEQQVLIQSLTDRITALETP